MPETMTQALRDDIRINSRILSSGEMKRHLSEVLGHPVKQPEFTRLMREALPLEKEYQAEIIRWLKKEYRDAFIWKAGAGVYARIGIPDVCAVIRSRFFGFEVKRPYIGKPTGIQTATMAQIIKAGGVAGVVSFPEDCAELIRKAWR